jgi:HSP20 family molecular chaperone IbpA
MKNKILSLTTLLVLIASTSMAENWLSKSFKKSNDPIKSITENKIKNTLELESNLAGFKKEDIKISISGGVLKVNAEKKDTSSKFDESEKKLVYKQKELLHKSFQLDLKKYNVNLDNPQSIKTVYNDGILWMSIPRCKNAQTDFIIRIKSGADA